MTATTQTDSNRASYVAQKIADRMAYQHGPRFRVESKVIACDGGADVVATSVLLDRPGTWPMVVAAVDDAGRKIHEVAGGLLARAVSL